MPQGLRRSRAKAIPCDKVMPLPFELYDYAQFLRQVSQTVILSQPYHAPLRDLNDLDVLQTAERGASDVLCSNDGDFHEPAIVGYCASRGIEVCNENTLLARLVGT